MIKTGKCCEQKGQGFSQCITGGPGSFWWGRSIFSEKRHWSCCLKDELDLIRRKCSMRAGKSMFRQKEQRLQNPGLEGGTCGGHWGEQGQDTHSHQLCTEPLAEVQAAYLSRPHLDSPTALHSYPTSPGFRLRSYPSSFNTCFSVGLLETNCSMSFQKISFFHLFFFLVTLSFPSSFIDIWLHTIKNYLFKVYRQ